MTPTATWDARLLSRPTASRTFSIFAARATFLDTACSSSLVALDSACEAIWSGRSHIAITGAVNLLLSPFQWVGFSKAQMLSRQGCCRVFDAAADGYVRSEGGGVLVLKPLDSAQADGDPVRAVILASATNSDGRTQGLFVPSAKAQEALLREAVAYLRVSTRSQDLANQKLAIQGPLGPSEQLPLGFGSGEAFLGPFRDQVPLDGLTTHSTASSWTAPASSS